MITCYATEGRISVAGYMESNMRSFDDERYIVSYERLPHVRPTVSIFRRIWEHERRERITTA
jgi:hypothetical protein